MLFREIDHDLYIDVTLKRAKHYCIKISQHRRYVKTASRHRYYNVTSVAKYSFCLE